ncbi:amino acid dehydrogenase [Burkholderia stagnalis]|uniref:FAD-binding oxidoreductase n=1 Tax=Burkholderia stagnalis TaxID=1503054 RepID=A0A6L3MPE6_9BURK|nr:FAD-dependent oxidoreductase [Burkholderia stagnalis]KAB0633784.1 FAD-binding oxidoreductase [Burkholderia stagnalis]KVO34721.1 amino acid dehydrogenase [Burkholderia stagnalis]KVO78079.1 amino acid dehydrogenase [Burkholderia stagnalis]KVW56745.1 amino acid dehydrogenase [Burkholderia stagnalis]KVW82675.1 amino acid dehydrogenase [Burkholderia stagnalis]
MSRYDFIVIGAGVIGASVAHHLASLGAGNVLVLERGMIGTGTTSQSSGLLRTHYSVRHNVELARASWWAFNNFAEYVGDDEASCGLVKCGYMICAPDGDKLEPLRASLDVQRAMGIEVEMLDRQAAQARLPIARFDDAALIGFEPEAGFADAYLVATSFAKSARRRGVKILEGTTVTGVLREGRRVVGVDTTAGRFTCGTLISTQNIWTPELSGWIDVPLPVMPERHTVLALECDAHYSFKMPAFKDLGSPGMLYYRSYGGSQMLVSEGVVGETLNVPETEQGDISLDYVAEVGAQVAERFPAYETAGLASSWTGVYDVTPDWNPVLGNVGDIDGLVVGFGFSGHGFKLSPGIGKLLAQHALGLPTDVSLAPYALERFSTGALLTGKYGLGAVS